MLLTTLVKDVRTLPAIPTTVTRLEAMLTDAKSSISDVAGVIRSDPGLTGNLLRVANSASYRGRMPTHSVQDACARLGTRLVYELLAADWLRNSCPATLPFYGRRAQDFWLHSLGTAVAAEQLASLAGLDTSAAFSGGLLHDTGELVIARAAEQQNIAPFARGKEPVEAEVEAVGADHAQVGHALATLWMMPPGVASAIRFHHAPELAALQDRRLASCVAVASELALSVGLGIAHVRAKPAQQHLEMLGVDRTAVMAVADPTIAKVRKMVSALVPGGLT
jgi:putative nucleotidyltransferase with HDIG domain